MLIRLSDKKYPCTMDDVHKDHPNKIIPTELSSEDLLSLGYASVNTKTAPVINPEIENVIEGQPELFIGVYRQSWVVTSLPQADLEIQFYGKKTLLISLVEQKRDAKRYADVTAHSRQWQADPISKGLMSDAIILAQAGAPLPDVWRDVDNNDMTLESINDLLTIAGAMAVQTEEAYIWSWQKKAEIEASTTIEALNAIDIS